MKKQTKQATKVGGSAGIIFFKKKFFLFFMLIVVGSLLFFKKPLFFYVDMVSRKLSSSEKTLFEYERNQKIIQLYKGNVFGFDISHYQRQQDISWNNLTLLHTDIELSFVILRATMGVEGNDANFDTFWKEAKKQGLITGAYHFYRPDEDPIEQAENFLRKINLKKGDLPPILDIEKFPTKITLQEFRANLKTFLDKVETQTGQKPIIYTYYNYYTGFVQYHFKNYPLWIANYNNVNEPLIKTKWLMWQFTDHGEISGIRKRVDLNVFNGNYNEFKKILIGGNKKEQ